MADLTTLAAVKQFLSLTTSNQDALIARLITRESRLIEQWCGRSFAPVTRTGLRINGTGTSVIPLPDAPVLTISSLADGTTPIAASDGTSAGYLFDDERLYLTNGARFTRGLKNILITYTAGYQESETDFIPTDNPAVLSPSTGGFALVPVSVVDSNGVSFTLVGSSPTTGRYTFEAGVFTFNTADAGRRVTMTYAYVPGPVDQACVEMVSLDLKNRDNLGIQSRSLDGESVSFSQKGMLPSVVEQLTPYRRRLVA